MAFSAPCSTTPNLLAELALAGYMSLDTWSRCRPAAGEEESRPRPNEVVAFAHYVRAGLGFPASMFLRGVLFYYGISLHHLAPNTITTLAVFAAFCEGWLGLRPDLNILTRYFRGNVAAGECPWGSGSFFLQLRGTSRPFIAIPRPLLDPEWRRQWFYVDVAGYPEMPPYSSVVVASNDRFDWGPSAQIWEKYRPAEERIDLLRDAGLCGIRVLLEVYARRIAPLAVRSRGM